MRGDNPLKAEATAGTRKGLPVYGLVGDMAWAERIVKAAKLFHVPARNFSKSELLVTNARNEKPCLVILDCDACEAEAFKVMDQFRQSDDLKASVLIGYVSAVKRQTGEEARRAGCLNVYLKTEFIKNLNDLMMRYIR